MTAIPKMSRIIPMQNSFMKRGLVVIIAFMVWIMLVCMTGAYMVSKKISEWDTGYENTISISVLYASDVSTNIRKKNMAQLEKLFGERTGIESFRIVPDQEKQSTLSDWLGTGVSYDTIDLPILWDIRINKDLDIEAFRRDVQAIYADAVVDDYAQWQDTLIVLGKQFIWVVYGIVAGVLCMVMGILFICMRMLISIHLPTLEILVLLGVEDRKIERPIGWYGFWMGIRGAIWGTILFIMGMGAMVWWHGGFELAQTIIRADMGRILAVGAIVVLVGIMSRIGVKYSVRTILRKQYPV